MADGFEAAKAIDADTMEARLVQLDVLERSLTGYETEDPPLPGSPLPVEHFNSAYRDEGLDWPSTGLTMIGRRRLRNFREIIERVIREEVPGDIIETGVWRGGASILARGVLAAWGVTDRVVIVADSFEGLPAPDVDRFPADDGSTLHVYPQLAVSLEEVQANFARFGLLDDQVQFLKGWFRDTMPRVESSAFAVIRLDGDMYESTMDPLVHLYDRLSPGGWVIIDDYLLEGCARAVHDFLDERDLHPEIVPIDRVGAFFQKVI